MTYSYFIKSKQEQMYLSKEDTFTSRTFMDPTAYGAESREAAETKLAALAIDLDSVIIFKTPTRY